MERARVPLFSRASTRAVFVSMKTLFASWRISGVVTLMPSMYSDSIPWESKRREGKGGEGRGGEGGRGGEVCVCLCDLCAYVCL
jgi:hypothetical protein